MFHSGRNGVNGGNGRYRGFTFLAGVKYSFTTEMYLSILWGYNRIKIRFLYGYTLTTYALMSICWINLFDIEHQPPFCPTYFTKGGFLIIFEFHLSVGTFGAFKYHNNITHTLYLLISQL